MFANIMAISAKELSWEATYGVRVCDEARFDFKRSQTPSVTAAPCHLPLHKGGLPDSIAIASFGRKSIVFCSFQQCQYVLKQDGFIRDGGWLRRHFCHSRRETFCRFDMQEKRQRNSAYAENVLNVYGKQRVSCFFQSFYDSAFKRSAINSARYNGTLFSLTNHRKPRLPCVKGAVSAAD